MAAGGFRRLRSIIHTFGIHVRNTGTDPVFAAFLLHLHPRTVPAETLRFTLSFGLGGMAATLVGILFISGILQLLSYSPQVSTAYLSITRMYAAGDLAGFIRNTHHWSGNLLVFVLLLHLLRVLLTGALGGRRRINWLIGTVLLLLALGANFTGYLLPWDERAYWAVTIFTAMASYIPLVGEQAAMLLRGGPEVSQQTLATFFAIHVGIVPMLMAGFAVWHFWQIRRAGGLVRRSDRQSMQTERLPVMPCLVHREAAVGLVLLASVLLFSALVDAPLGSEANPASSPNPAKAAWYFMGLQELLLHVHPAFAVCVVPLFLLSAFLAIPFIDGAVLPGGRWFGTRRGARAAGVSLAAGLLLTAVAVAADDLLVRRTGAGRADWLLRGFVPLAGCIALLGAWYAVIRRTGACSRAEALAALALFVLGAVIGLSVIGIWFRGPEMALTWPG